jgi:hypothetical protein
MVRSLPPDCGTPADAATHTRGGTAMALPVLVIQASAPLCHRRGYAQRVRPGSKVLLVGVLAVLVGVNVLLLFLLFRPEWVLTARPSHQDAGDVGSPIATSSPAPDASTSPTSSTRPIESVPAKRLLLAMSAKTAWRSTVGDCNNPGKIERSTNGGAGWKEVVRTGPAPIVRLGAEPSGDLFAIGGTRRSCSVRYVTYAGDGTVTTSTSPANVWFPTPENRDEINGPDGTKDTPCHGHAIGLASLSLSRALVMCDDGTAMSSSNSGKTWRQLARIPDALALTAGSGRYWVAAAHEGCDGVTVQSLTEESGSLRREEPVVLLASKSPPVKWPSMSPMTAQSGCGVAAESSSQGTMARHGNDGGCTGLTWEHLPDPASRVWAVGSIRFWKTVSQPLRRPGNS